MSTVGLTIEQAVANAQAGTIAQTAPPPPPPTPEPVHKSFISTVEADVNKVLNKGKADVKKAVSILELAGEEAAKGLTYVVQYLPKAETIFDLIFPDPAADAAVAAGVSTIDYIQKGVVAMEAAYATSGISGETGAKKSADLLTLSESVLLPLFQGYMPTATTADLQAIINKVVAILGVVDAPATATS
jgi:hypothetical protein